MKKKILTFAFLATGFLLGASALFVDAQVDGTWVTPQCPPPGCNVPEPVNVGIDQQIKLGSLILNADGGTTAPYGLYVFGKSFFNESIVIPSSTPTTGKVLAALNDEGLVGWQMPPSASAPNRCVSETSSESAAKSISLVIGGKNICADVNGCEVQAYRIARAGSARGFPVLDTIKNYRQDSRGIFSGNTSGTTEGTVNQRDTNGNNASDYIFSASTASVLKDDNTSVETRPDAWTIERTQNSDSWEIVVCD